MERYLPVKQPTPPQDITGQQNNPCKATKKTVMDKTNRTKKKNPETTLKTEKEKRERQHKNPVVTTWSGDPQVAATGNTGSLVNSVLFNQRCPQKPSVTGATEEAFCFSLCEATWLQNSTMKHSASVPRESRRARE